MKKYLIGTDIGTSGTKSILIDVEGNVLCDSFESYDVLSPNPSWAEQWPQEWENATYKTISDVVKNSKVSPEQIGGICISGLFAGSGVPVDKNYEPVRPAIIWMDRRAQNESEYVENIIGTEKLFKVTGNRNDAYFGFSKILWIKNNEPENWNKIKMFLPSNSYVVYKITGNITIDYTAAANIGGIYNLLKNDWAYDLMDKMGIPESMMPKDFYNPQDIVGYVTKEASEKLGIPEGVPICAGCTDCLASTLAAGALEAGNQIAVIGTSINWGVLHKDFPKNKKCVTMPYVIDPKNMYYTYGGASTAGVLAKWFKDNFAPFTSLNGMTEETDYKILDKEASIINPGSNGILILPYFMGERTPIWDANAKGTIFGLSLNHGREFVFRALLESVAYSLRHIIESSNIDLGVDAKCVITGGATNSKLWMEIFADVTGLPIVCTKGEAQAPLGDALVAGVATGLIKDYSVIHDWIKYDDSIYPNKKNHEIYNKYFKLYKDLYVSLKENMKELSNISK